MKKILCFLALLFASIGANAQVTSPLVGFNCQGINPVQPTYASLYNLGNQCTPIGTGGSGNVTIPSYATQKGGEPGWIVGAKLNFDLALIGSLLYGNQNPNFIFAGPASGAPGAPSFRAPVPADAVGSPVYQITNPSYTFPGNGDTTINSADTGGSVLEFNTGASWTANIYSNGCATSGDIKTGGY